MPPADRRRFVPQAIAQFLHQDYEHRELIVLDDGVQSVEDLMPDDPRVRYVREERAMGHIFEKRDISF
jgi:glycosyltransferase involved in cell wall biosynthesis